MKDFYIYIAVFMGWWNCMDCGGRDPEIRALKNQISQLELKVHRLENR